MRLCRSSFLTLPRFLLSSPPPRPSSIAHPSPPPPPPPPSQIPHLRPFHLSHPSPQASSPHQPAHIDPSPYEDQERGPFSDKILRLRDEIASLSDDELRQMSAALRKKLGLPEPVAMPAGLSMMPAGAMGWGDDAGGQASAEERPPEKTSFDVKLEKFDAASKIKVIKEVRAITSLGLKEAKDLVEKTPSVIKTGVSKEEATQVMEKLKVVGATVTME